METRCKFSINCENENPKDPPIAYCVFSSNWGEIVTCKMSVVALSYHRKLRLVTSILLINVAPKLRYNIC
jgi:hypothetical protein